ncbi:MAG: helix-hairpin-helix domain-containing protein [Bacteroidales bacterium]|nr:helix-hairpin-helix domain-containing protein [Bacteroidales bacterium]
MPVWQFLTPGSISRNGGSDSSGIGGQFAPEYTGDVLSGRIINARPFNSIHEIKDVKGIGPKTFEDIRWKIIAE